MSRTRNLNEDSQPSPVGYGRSLEHYLANIDEWTRLWQTDLLHRKCLSEFILQQGWFKVYRRLMAGEGKAR